MTLFVLVVVVVPTGTIWDKLDIGKWSQTERNRKQTYNSLADHQTTGRIHGISLSSTVHAQLSPSLTLLLTSDKDFLPSSFGRSTQGIIFGHYTNNRVNSEVR